MSTQAWLKSTILLFMTCFSSAGLSEIQFPVQHQVDRFEKHLKTIDIYMDRVQNVREFATVTDILNSSDLRSSLQRIQDLLRIYKKSKKRYEPLKPYFDKFKEFEDHISHLRDVKSYARSASGSARTKYIKLKEEEINSYQEFLNTSDFFKSGEERLTNKFRQILGQIDWPDLVKDRDHILAGISKYYKQQNEEVYNFNDPELGFHELRRDARRLSYFNYAIDDLVVGSENMACPLGAEAKKIERKVPKSYRCYIPYCLISSLGDLNSYMSSLRSDGFYYELRGEEIPESISKRAATKHEEVINSQLFLHLKEYTNGCRSPKNDEGK